MERNSVAIPLFSSINRLPVSTKAERSYGLPNRSDPKWGKLSYKDGFLLIRGDEMKTVHISEIHTLIIDSTMVTMTAYLLCELMKEKINVIVCDEKRNPVGTLLPLHGSHDSSGRIAEQTEWTETCKAQLWQKLIAAKIRNQACLLKAAAPESAQQLLRYAEDVTPADVTNREGHAAKVYFNRIFGEGFTRDLKTDRNAALNYGYSLLLSCFNKEIASRGYVPQLGIHHCNRFNPFNLASDLMEPFRCLVDAAVLKMGEMQFDKSCKHKLLDLLNCSFCYQDQEMYTTTAIAKYVRNTTEYLCGRLEWKENMVMRYEDTNDARDCYV